MMMAESTVNHSQSCINIGCIGAICEHKWHIQRYIILTVKCCTNSISANMTHRIFWYGRYDELFGSENSNHYSPKCQARKTGEDGVS